jgi:hypothetical protein
MVPKYHHNAYIHTNPRELRIGNTIIIITDVAFYGATLMDRETAVPGVSCMCIYVYIYIYEYNILYSYRYIYIYILYCARYTR